MMIVRLFFLFFFSFLSFFVPRNPNYINLLILNAYLLFSGNDNNRENLKTTMFLSKKHLGMTNSIDPME